MTDTVGNKSDMAPIETKELTKQLGGPRVAFLGFCDRSVEVQKGSPPFWHQNLIGLSMSRVSYIFPFILRGMQVAIALFDARVGEEFTIRFRPTHKQDPIDLKVGIVAGDWLKSTAEGIKETALQKGECIPGWLFRVYAYPVDSLIHEPGECGVFLVEPDQEILLGNALFCHAVVPPFTSDYIAAIRSDPLALKFVRIAVGCKLCDDHLRAYAGIERSPKSEGEGWAWYASLPDRFHCKCGNLDFSLTYIRTGLHGLLARRLSPPTSSSVSGVRLYEKSALEEKCRELLALLHAATKEEELQIFLSNNQIFFHIFLPVKLMSKKPVLTMYEADYAVLNQRNELVLVEIERPDLPLIKKDGGIRAELEHAFEQVRQWIRVFNEQRSAALLCVGLKNEEVAKVRGAVIAGRTPGDPDLARSLRAHSWVDIELFTYDDILNSITDVIRQIATA